MIPTQDLLAEATKIKLESVENNNSANRVGSWMEQVIPYLEDIDSKAESGGSAKTLKNLDDEIVQLAGNASKISTRATTLGKTTDLIGKYIGEVYSTTPIPTTSEYGDIYIAADANVWGLTVAAGKYLFYNGTSFVPKYEYEIKKHWHSKTRNTYSFQYNWDDILNAILDVKLLYPANAVIEDKYILSWVYLSTNKILFMRLNNYNPTTDTYDHFAPESPIPHIFSEYKGVQTTRFLIDSQRKVYADITIDYDLINAQAVYDYAFASGNDSLLRNCYILNKQYYFDNTDKQTPAHLIAASDSATGIYTEKCTGVSDQIIINKHIQQVSTAGGGIVELSDGNFSISGAIVMYPNVMLKSTHNTKIKLANGASAYMVTNHNYISGQGTSNICIDGGIWNGNKAGGQTRNYTGNPTQTYWGFGFFFKETDGLRILNLTVETTEAWGIAHFRTKNARFENIEFWQSNNIGANGDGITGTSMQNIIIKNIRGYTNDDLIAVAAFNRFGGSLGGNEIWWTDDGFETKGVVIEEIHSMKHKVSGFYSHRILGIYSCDNVLIDDIFVNRITGGWHADAYAIGIINYWANHPTMIPISNIGKVVIRNVDLYSDALNPNIISLSNLPYLKMDNLIVNNVSFNCGTANQLILLNLLDGCKNIHVSNITCNNTGAGNIVPVRLSKNNAESNVNANIYGIDKKSNVLSIDVLSGSGLVRINSNHKLNKSLINNMVDGDSVVDIDNKPYVYLNSLWNALF